jgi:uncharacterized protein YidB (DUF937 family)
MFENLISLIEQHAGNAVINNPAVPNEQNNAVISEAGNSIVGTLKNMVSQGNMQEVLNLFNNSGNAGTGTAAQSISNNFIQTLTSKFGLGQSAASGIAASLIPNVLQSLVNKTNDPADTSFNLQGIISHLTGAASGGNVAPGGGIMDSIKGLFGQH